MLNIMIFGGLGRTAEPIIELLGTEKHNVTVFDISAKNPYFDDNIKVINGDICINEVVNNALRGIDIVVHLAVSTTAPKDDEVSFRTNVYGTFNIMYNSMLNKVSKILVASSAPVHNADKLTGMDDYCCSAEDDFVYDLTKSLQETMAQHFSRTFSMNCLVLRLGHIVDGKRKTTLSGSPLSGLSYCNGGWVCKYDVAKSFVKAIETDFSGYHVINVIGSYQSTDLFNLAPAKNLLSFECDEKFLDW